MPYEIAHAEGFPSELGRAKQKVRKALPKVVYPILRETPEMPDPPRIKKLADWKDLWRFRISDEYRLVYRVDRKTHTVTLLMLGLRSTIYERLGAKDDGSPGVRIVARAEDLLERVPTEEEVGRAEIAMAESEQGHKSQLGKQLEIKLTTDLLAGIGVSPKYHHEIVQVKTDDELLELSIPSVELERVLNFIWPPTIEQVVQQPVRVAANLEDLELVGSGQRSLESFLLKLDDEQRSFLTRFDKPNPQGPWLVKGGPGSGKSTMALYCIQSLIKNAREMIPGQSRPLRILFTTFTKSLINSSEHLLESLDVHGGQHRVDVLNVDKLASKFLPPEWRERTLASEWRLHQLAEAAIDDCRSTDNRYAFDRSDMEFLLEETNWVIQGHGVKSIDEYLAVERSGRGRAIGSQQRRQIWRFYDAFRRSMNNEGLFMFSDRLGAALDRVRSEYDYVFIDEAQDLSPVAIRLCIGLCREPENVFLTADSNQSIYGNVMSWSKVSKDLRFAGKARILRKNYRATKEIWRAIQQFAPDSSESDPETLEIQSVYSGPPPVYAKCQSSTVLAERLNRFIYESMRAERVGPQSVAVLCQTKSERDGVMKLLDKRFNPKSMNSKETDLSHPGVKVMTMHAAKGLQFPIVVVYGFSGGFMPTPPKEGVDVSEHNERERRLLFVACTRAMRQLLLVGSSMNPSPFATNVTDEFWDIEDL